MNLCLFSVTSTYKEPLKGWVNNLYGPTGVCAGAGTGILRTMHCDADVNANIIPVDMCVNALIATAWDVGQNYKKSKKSEENFEIFVYHYESSSENPITWGKFMDRCAHYGIHTPSVKAIWYYCIVLYKSLLLYRLTQVLLHYLPAFVADGVLLCIGKSPR